MNVSSLEVKGWNGIRPRLRPDGSEVVVVSGCYLLARMPKLVDAPAFQMPPMEWETWAVRRAYI